MGGELLFEEASPFLSERCQGGGAPARLFGGLVEHALGRFNLFREVFKGRQLFFQLLIQGENLWPIFALLAVNKREPLFEVGKPRGIVLIPT